MGQIDRAGTYQGKVLESALGQTKQNGYPQWVARLETTKYYVADKPTMEHYKITEPGYVEWPGDTILAYLVLFSEKGPLLNDAQLQLAMGWDGQDFQDLLGFVGKELLFRVEEDTYNGVTSLKVNWIDAKDAPPERTLKTVDADKMAEMTKKFLANRAKPTAPARPAPAKASVPVGKPPAPASVPAPAAPAAPTPAAAASPAEPAAESPKKNPPGRPKKTPPPPEATTGGLPDALPTETTKEKAWEFLNEPTTRGSNDEGTVADAWIAACQEVGEDIDESKFTGEMWAKVRNIVLKDLGVKVA